MNGTILLAIMKNVRKADEIARWEWWWWWLWEIITDQDELL